MKKEDILTVPEFYQGYIDQAPADTELINALPEGGIALFTGHINELQALGLKTYAEGKWTVPQILEHLMDTERIFLNRALRFARKDKTELPGYDENFYVANSRSNEFSIERLLMQYIGIRSATLATFANFNEEELMRTGIANGNEISVLALGFIQIGHAVHHFNVIQERYFPLLSKN
ncbi:MAG: DinB family protein [Crocinitomicaceae bacterium]|nr:DinB family protein [Crocinitomicaceae bacterium]